MTHWPVSGSSRPVAYQKLAPETGQCVITIGWVKDVTV